MLDTNHSLNDQPDTQVCIVCEKPFAALKEQQMCEHCINVLSLCTEG